MRTSAVEAAINTRTLYVECRAMAARRTPALRRRGNGRRVIRKVDSVGDPAGGAAVSLATTLLASHDARLPPKLGDARLPPKLGGVEIADTAKP
jgi:hypothetical protein